MVSPGAHHAPSPQEPVLAPLNRSRWELTFSTVRDWGRFNPKKNRLLVTRFLI